MDIKTEGNLDERIENIEKDKNNSIVNDELESQVLDVETGVEIRRSKRTIRKPERYRE